MVSNLEFCTTPSAVTQTGRMKTVSVVQVPECLASRQRTELSSRMSVGSMGDKEGWRKAKGNCMRDGVKGHP